jgi:hypothetical protein
MTENKWLIGMDGEAMLDAVAEQLSPRQWVLLSAAFVRKLWDLLPEGVLRQAVDHAERTIQPFSEADRAQWRARIEAGIPAAIHAAQQAVGEIVKTCDPEAAELDRPVLTRPNQSAPAFPLFQAASHSARRAIDGIATAVAEAAQAVRALYIEPSADMLDVVRSHVDQACELRTLANRATNTALRLKHKGDEIADQAVGTKNKRLLESIALEEVRKIEEPRSRSEIDEFAAQERRDRAARKQLALALREIVGNPFRPPRFDPNWRTSTVKQLAEGIFDDRAFDRLPILADALLDADCDEEAILRHCRGTELHVKETREPVHHVRGCWVIELILGRFQPLSPLDPNRPIRRRRRIEDLDIGLPFNLGDDRIV